MTLHPSSTSRLNWIDALRGLTMLSVVMVHVLVSGFGLNPNQSPLAILRGTFTLPLFFFVSGFFLCRPVAEWTRTRITRALRVRSLALLGGTILFSTLYFIVMHRADPLSWLPDANFVEYWYTISLFQIFIWYILFTLAGRLTSPHLTWTLILIAALASAALPYTPWASSYWCYWWLNEKTLLYFQYFAIGMAVRRWQEPFFSWLSRPWVLTLLIIGYCSSLMAGWTYTNFWTDHAPWMLIIVREELSRLFGLLLVLRIFYMAREWFDRDTPLLRIWLLIGRRTLDIYFLHYFLVPRMRWVGAYLRHGNTFIPEFIAAAIVAAVILAIILPMSRLLRTAPLIRPLLGAKSPKPKPAP